ncbi:MAG: alpha-E domain-containing protein [Kiloniellales bacterium]
MSSLLSRHAEATYWLARYIERAENLARILDVNETFSRDSRGGQNWQSILQLYADEARFRETHGTATAAAVIEFYTLDPGNPTSILSAIAAARENARSLRPLISTEMWAQMNIFYNRLKAAQRTDVEEPRLVRFCAVVKEACQAHTGITEGTFYRDEAWYFYQLGRLIERADQTTRLLDVKYHLLLPSSGAVGSPLDMSFWNAVLRSAAGYHAFRRVQPSGMSPATVTGFLLFHRAFPRSVRGCIEDLLRCLGELMLGYRLENGREAEAALRSLAQRLNQDTAERVISGGLHEYLDELQQDLLAIGNALARAYFDHAADGQAA